KGLLGAPQLGSVSGSGGLQLSKTALAFFGAEKLQTQLYSFSSEFSQHSSQRATDASQSQALPSSSAPSAPRQRSGDSAALEQPKADLRHAGLGQLHG
uniref:Tumor protein p53 regulated apoptosis inducing protein 1 n=1 Tax=Macrostomum lignano TaxID=282301 RepID=A0A1I8GX07_9PLAT